MSEQMNIGGWVEGGRTLRIGTRGSRLARWQTDWVAGALGRLHPGLEIEVVEIKTEGDRDRNTPLAAIGGAGLFTKEIQRALSENRVDLAVHSLKDLPTDPTPGLVLGAIPPREVAMDALIAPRHGHMKDLPQGARVGTSSPRRRAMLLHSRPDLEVVNLRGNVETRLRAATEGPLDAVVLAEAGLHRLGLESHVTDRLVPPGFLPAPGQGALGLECRADDREVIGLLAPLDDPATRRAVSAERATLAGLGGGCSAPMGAWGRVEDDGLLLVLDATVLDLDGRRRLDVTVGPGDDPVALGLQAARFLLEGGAGGLLTSGRD